MTQSRTAVFRYLVRDHMRPPPVVARPARPAADVVARMAAARASAAILVDACARPVGILTEQDVVRRIALRPLGATPVGELMTRPVMTMQDDRPLYEAVGRMRRLGLRHMPVVDAAGALRGMVFLDDALAAAQPQLVDAIDRLTHEETLDGLREVKAAQVRLAAELFEDHVPAPAIQALISGINNDLHRRVLRLTLEALEAEGFGPPPVPFAALVLGSGGRSESFLFPDQDNGFVLADYPDEAHARIDPFFIELAARMNAELDRLGFPWCRGGVMAINPVWRKTLSQWHSQIGRWVGQRSATALQLCDILFDFRTVFGQAGLGDALRSTILGLLRANPGVLRDMFGVQADHRAALGWFGRLVTARGDPGHRGEIDLKYAGTLPLAEAVRLLALRHQVRATGTLERIDALAGEGQLEADERDYLEGAFAHITGLQLRQQIRDYQAGRTPGNFVHPDQLTRREVDILKDSFRAINAFRARLRAELTGEVF